MKNPIIQRELIGMLRTPQALFLQIVMLATFAALVVLRWPDDPQSVTGSQAKQVFGLFGYSVLTAMIIFVPIFPATSIVREKNKGTLELLLISPMSSVSIYIGKLIGVIGFVLLLLILSTPAVAACYTMGGIDFAREVIPLYGILLLASLQYAVLGLLVSTFVNSTDAAMRLTYAFVLAMSVLTIIPHLFVQGTESWLTGIALRLRCVSPIPAAMELLGHRDVGGHGQATESIAVRIYLIISAISIACMAVLTITRLSLKIFDQTRDQGVITDDLDSGDKFLRLIWYLGVFDPQKRTSGIPWYMNPVMVKEFRCRRFGRKHWMMRLLVSCVVISLLLAFATSAGSEDWGAETIGGIMVILQIALIIVLTPSLAAGLISTELESGGWSLLQCTPISWLRILTGKLMSVVWTVALVVISTLPGYVVMFYVEPQMWPQISRVMICLGMTCLFALLLSTYVSSLFHKTSVATTVAFLLLIGLSAGTMLVWLGRGAPFGHSTVEAALMFSPLAAALNATEMPGFTEYKLLPYNWYILGSASFALLVALSYRTWKLTLPR